MMAGGGRGRVRRRGGVDWSVESQERGDAVPAGDSRV